MNKELKVLNARLRSLTDLRKEKEVLAEQFGFEQWKQEIEELTNMIRHTMKNIRRVLEENHLMD